MAFSRIVFDVFLIVSLVANISVEGADTETYCMNPANPGDTTTLTCTITGKINGGIRWIRPIASHPETEVAKCDTRNTFCVYHGNITGYTAVAVTPTRNDLTIDSFNPVIDAGEWTCQDGMVGFVKHKCNKTVTAGPHNVTLDLGSPGFIIEGDNMTVNCTARCNPSPCSFSWAVDNDTVSSGALLSLTDISSAQDGNVYTCTVNNTAIPNSTSIQFTLNIRHGPEHVLGLSDASATWGIVIVLAGLLVLAFPSVWIVYKKDIKKKAESLQNEYNRVRISPQC